MGEAKRWKKRFRDLRKGEIQAIRDKTPRRCWYCGCRLLEKLPDVPDALWDLLEPLFSSMREYSHRVPPSKGGLTTVDNIVPACSGCARRKRTKSVEEFRTYLQNRGELPHGFYFEHQSKEPVWEWCKRCGGEGWVVPFATGAPELCRTCDGRREVEVLEP